MMMDTIDDTNGTAFICPECSFNGSSLPELISHLTEAHGEDIGNQNETQPVSSMSTNHVEKRSRRKPAFSHQIVSQVPRQSSPVFAPSKVDPGSIHFWNRVVTTGKPEQRNSQTNGNSHTYRQENAKRVNLTPPRPIAPKNTLTPPQLIHSMPTAPSAPLYSQSMQPIQKNFQCRICHLTYKNFHDCTAHIRRKHEMSHAQAGRYVEKLDTDVALPPSATGHYKIRLKVKSLPPLLPSTTTAEELPKIHRCKFCPFTSHWPKEIAQHEQRHHPNYSSYEPGEAVDTSNGLASLLIDDIHELGEEIESSHDDMMIIEEDNDDDEDEALWKYQQELQNLNEFNVNNQPQPSFPKHLKRFQCPHCEHTSPTLTKLKLHIATHINVKPYMCSICGWRANLRWYIQCHARKRHSNQHFEVLQLSHEEAEQTISAYIKERGIENKLSNRHDSKHQFQCSLCQFRSNHPRYVQQHIEMTHKTVLKPHSQSYSHSTVATETASRPLASPSQIVYENFSSHPNFNPNRLYYCSLCYRGYRWRYDVKRHHKTMHDTSDDEMLKNRNFNYLEYVPHLDGLITATMSSLGNHSKLENDNEEEAGAVIDDDDDLKLSIADARTVDVNDDEAAALLMIEPPNRQAEPILIDDHPDDAVIIFEDDRMEKPSTEIPRSTPTSSSRPSFKPYQCPYCFYRTNWRTDCLRHIRARHKVEPNQNGYYELSAEEAERTYEEYERTYGFVVSKKVLARFTDFRQIEWNDLKKSIWEKIKDKTDFEQIIFDRLRPDNYSSPPAAAVPTAPVIVNAEPKPATSAVNLPPVRIPLFKSKRMFTCMDCAFRSWKIYELEKHFCSKSRQKRWNNSKCSILIYECNKCSYRTREENSIRQHVYFHRLKDLKKKSFYYCSFCGYNHRCRAKISLHIAKNHPNKSASHTLMSSRIALDADFTIRQATIKRSFIDQHSTTKSLYSCISCPFVSTSILEYDHHRSAHQKNHSNIYQCHFCSFASNSSLYTNQHMLLHTDRSQHVSSTTDLKNLKKISMTTIYKEILGKPRRYYCPFCQKCASNNSSIILKHVKNIHLENSKQFHQNLLIGEEAAKEILSL